MKPTRDNVLISRVEPNLTTESGIILKNPLEPDRALIKGIGPDVTEVSVGEKTMVDAGFLRRLVCVLQRAGSLYLYRRQRADGVA